MKRILYAGGSFLTDDVVADALMEYARVLAIVDSADVVEVPGIDADGTVQTMRLLIGPASQLLATSTDEVVSGLDVDSALSDLRERAHRRLPHSFDVGDTAGPAESDAESTEH